MDEILLKRDPLSLFFPFNLKQLTSISLAISFWNDPEIKKDVKKYFVKDFDKTKAEPYGQKWTKIGQKISKRVDNMELPLELVSELKDIVFLVGEKLYWWSVHVIGECDINVKYSENIFWKSYGTVDEVKVFKSWLQDPTFPGFNEYIGDKSILFGMACHYAQEKFLKLNLKEAASVLSVLYLPNLLKQKLNSLHNVMALFVCYMVGDGKPDRALSIYKNLKGSTYPNASDKLFTLCVEFNIKEAAGYFFEKLNDCDKPKISYEVATNFVKSNFKERSGYKVEKLPELLLYLIKNMTDEQRFEFLKKNAGFCFQILVKTWPYQEICLPLVNFIWDDLKRSDQGFILNSVISVLTKAFKNCKVNKKTLRRIFQNLLQKSSKKLKTQKFVKEKLIIFDLFKAAEFETIKIIINDADLVGKKIKVSDISEYLVEYLMKGGTFASIDDYLNQINFSEDEIQLFKSKCDFFVDFSYNEADAGLVNQFLSWKFSFADEKTAKRLRLNYMKKFADSGKVDLFFTKEPIGQIPFRKY